MRKEFPILEFDEKDDAIINPSEIITPLDVPEHCVITFFKEVIDDLIKKGQAKEVARDKSEMGYHPIYELEFEGKRILMYLSGVTAPFAAALFEYVIHLGSKKFVACGSSGLLDREIANKVIVPISAIRDEGLSYHYLPPSREVLADTKAVKAVIDVLKKYKIDHITSKTWTTDGLYRETKQKIKIRKEEGCSTVEMEAAAFFAVAKFRNVQISQILYGSDDISGDEWDRMNLGKKISLREKLFWLAAEACLRL
ncbi:MAG: nucleoside phosphorylase [Promethearchaeota archaeon]